MADIPHWHVEGDWFDVCKCNIPCPCEFAQAADVRRLRGHPRVAHSRGPLRRREPRRPQRARASARSRATSGRTRRCRWASSSTSAPTTRSAKRCRRSSADRPAVGPAQFAQKIGEVRGIEYAPIEFEVAGDLATWRARSPARSRRRAEALTGPTTAAGSARAIVESAGLGSRARRGVATWGTAVVDRADAFGFKWNRSGQSSKHIPFAWHGPG